MKKRSVIFLTAFLALAFVTVIQAQDPPKVTKFSELCENLSLSTKTALFVKNYWAKVKGELVTWTGIVKNVKGGRGKAVIYAANRAKPTYRGYNMVLTTFDMEGAGNLEIGKRINFRGILYNYKGRKGSPVIVYLNEVEIL